MSRSRVLVLGASGRLGRMLQRHWPMAGPAPIWQYRKAPTPDRSVIAPIIGTTALAERCGSVDIVLNLAGTVPGRGDMALNRALGLAAVGLGATMSARHVFLASSAAVYGMSDDALGEDSLPAPQSAYGVAKVEMEQATAALAAELGVKVTHLRIGNVAGADALLAQPGTSRCLDQFADGSGPRRSYISPQVLTDVLAGLAARAAEGAAMPDVLNIAQPPALAMADLCEAAGFDVTWRAAPATALPCVELDVTRLQRLLPIPGTTAQGMIAAWRADAGGDG